MPRVCQARRHPGAAPQSDDGPEGQRPLPNVTSMQGGCRVRYMSARGGGLVQRPDHRGTPRTGARRRTDRGIRGRASAAMSSRSPRWRGSARRSAWWSWRNAMASCSVSGRSRSAASAHDARPEPSASWRSRACSSRLIHGDGRDPRVPLGDGDDIGGRPEAGVVPGARGEPAGAGDLQCPGVAQGGGEKAVGGAYGEDSEFHRIAVGGRGGLDQDVAAASAYVRLGPGESGAVAQVRTAAPALPKVSTASDDISPGAQGSRALLRPFRPCRPADGGRCHPLSAAPTPSFTPPPTPARAPRARM